MADPNKAVEGGFFFKINKRAGQIAIHMQENKRAGGFFLKFNKRACTSIRHTRVCTCLFSKALFLYIP